MRGRRGQSIIEYLVVAAAIIGALVAFNTHISNGMGKVGEHAKTAIQEGGNRVSGITVENR